MNAKKTYIHAYVSFLDILGFRGFVEDAETNANDVYKILYQAREASKVDEKETQILGIRNLAISDCMIRTADVNLPLDYVLAPDVLAEILALAYVQLEFFEKAKKPIRGGITHGKCYHDDDNFIFGPAYQEAVRLEKEAKYPRIIVSKAIINDYKGYPEGNGDVTFADADQDLNKLVKIDPNDDKYFIDYMGIYLSDPDANWDLFLDDHRMFILKNLHDLKSTRHYEKYVWLREYHNRTISALRNCRQFRIP